MNKIVKKKVKKDNWKPKNDIISDRLTNTTQIHEEGEAAKTTEMEIEPSDESPMDYEYAPDN